MSNFKTQDLHNYITKVAAKELNNSSFLDTVTTGTITASHPGYYQVSLANSGDSAAVTAVSMNDATYNVNDYVYLLKAAAKGGDNFNNSYFIFGLATEVQTHYANLTEWERFNSNLSHVTVYNNDVEVSLTSIKDSDFDSSTNSVQNLISDIKAHGYFSITGYFTANGSEDFGLKIFLKENNTILETFVLDKNYFSGQVTKLAGAYQKRVCSLKEESTVVKLNNISIEGFNNTAGTNPTVQKITITAGSMYEAANNLEAKVSTLGNHKNFFRNLDAVAAGSDQIGLKATLFYNSQALAADNIRYYWCIKDESITKNSEDYFPLANEEGWRCLNGYSTVDVIGTEEVENIKVWNSSSTMIIDEYDGSFKNEYGTLVNTNVYNNIFDKEYTNIVACFIKYNNTIIKSNEFKVINYTKHEFTASLSLKNGGNISEIQRITDVTDSIPIECKIENSGAPISTTTTYSYKWKVTADDYDITSFIGGYEQTTDKEKRDGVQYYTKEEKEVNENKIYYYKEFSGNSFEEDVIYYIYKTLDQITNCPKLIIKDAYTINETSTLTRYLDTIEIELPEQIVKISDSVYKQDATLNKAVLDEYYRIWSEYEIALEEQIKNGDAEAIENINEKYTSIFTEDFTLLNNNQNFIDTKDAVIKVYAQIIVQPDSIDQAIILDIEEPVQIKSYTHLTEQIHSVFKYQYYLSTSMNVTFEKKSKADEAGVWSGEWNIKDPAHTDKENPPEWISIAAIDEWDVENEVFVDAGWDELDATVPGTSYDKSNQYYLYYTKQESSYVYQGSEKGREPLSEKSWNYPLCLKAFKYKNNLWIQAMESVEIDQINTFNQFTKGGIENGIYYDSDAYILTEDSIKDSNKTYYYNSTPTSSKPTYVEFKGENFVNGTNYYEKVESGDKLYINATFINTGTLRVGSPTNEKLYASIHNEDVRIAGWEVDDNSLTKGTVGLNSDETKLGGIAFWAGSETPANANFYVTHDGDVVARSIEIGGTLKDTIDQIEKDTSAAVGSATNAENTAQAAVESATNAENIAQSAVGSATAANQTAANAESIAQTANTNSVNAENIANEAIGAATTANTNSTNAINIANEASSAAAGAVDRVESFEGQLYFGATTLNGKNVIALKADNGIIYAKTNGLIINSDRLKLDHDGSKYNSGYFSIDTNNFKVSSTGHVTATSGEIGGWKIIKELGPNRNEMGLYSIRKDADGNINNSTGIANVSGTNTVAFWAGCPVEHPWIDNSNTAFYITNDGRLYARKAEIEGKVVADEGKIGSFEIKRNTLKGPNIIITEESLTTYSLSSNTIDLDSFIQTPKIQSSAGTALIFSIADESDEDLLENVKIFLKQEKMSSYKWWLSTSYEVSKQVQVSAIARYSWTSACGDDGGVQDYPFVLTISVGDRKSNNYEFDANPSVEDEWPTWHATFENLEITSVTVGGISIDYNQPDEMLPLFGSSDIGSFSQLNYNKTTKKIQSVGSIVPDERYKYDLGSTDYKWDKIYANSSSIITSDKNEKNNIVPLTAIYSSFFDRLIPVSYKFNENTNNRTHFGFIAQDVEQALLDIDLTTQDFAGICYWDRKDGTKGYGLRYEEFIALNTHEIQKLKKRVTEQDTEILELKEKLLKLENQLDLNKI